MKFLFLRLKELVLPKTDVTARVNIITGTSINDGATMAQNHFANDGVFLDINLKSR